MSIHPDCWDDVGRSLPTTIFSDAKKKNWSVSLICSNKGIATSNKKLLVAPGISTRNKELLGWRPLLLHMPATDHVVFLAPSPTLQRMLTEAAKTNGTQSTASRCAKSNLPAGTAREMETPPTKRRSADLSGPEQWYVAKPGEKKTITKEPKNSCSHGYWQAKGGLPSCSSEPKWAAPQSMTALLVTPQSTRIDYSIEVEVYT